MNIQFIHDNKGNTTGVFIPIEEWQTLKEKYAELQTEEVISTIELASWQTHIIDQRLADYYTNQTDIEDFDNMLNDIEKSL